MNTEALGNTRIGHVFIRLIAAIMESPLRYRFFGPGKILGGAGIRSGMQVLEIGCGTGFFTIPAGRMIGDQGRLTAMDMLPASVEAVSEKVRTAGLQNVTVVKGNALDTRLESGTFDEVIIFGVIPAPMLPMEKLMAEMHRVLKPGGVMAVWPPSWVNRSILKSGYFAFSNKRNGVMNYRKIEN
jgi:ubiquinone/menaquinone biosynthesis C-methylase UbiE